MAVIDQERGGWGHRALCRCALCKGKLPLLDRLHAKIAVTQNGCWLWTGKIAADGYGVIQHCGKTLRAHRAMYAASGMAIGTDDVACHHCDEPRCVNPAHIFLGSRADNNRDMARKGRARNMNVGKTHCVHGHAFDQNNTIVNRKGHRACRECNRRKLIRYRLNRREAA